MHIYIRNCVYVYVYISVCLFSFSLSLSIDLSIYLSTRLNFHVSLEECRGIQAGDDAEQKASQLY